MSKKIKGTTYKQAEKLVNTLNAESLVIEALELSLQVTMGNRLIDQVALREKLKAALEIVKAE